MAGFAVHRLTCMILACCLLFAPTSEAIPCESVVGYLTPCIFFVLGGARAPSYSCCSGVRTLNAVAHLTADRRSVCRCLKTFAGGIAGVNYGRVALVPGQCGVQLPYAVAPSTDCNKVT